MPRSLVLLMLASVAQCAALSASHARDPVIERGAEVFAMCQACHEVGLKARHRVGPLLNDIFGRRAGTLDGYRYSRALADAGQNGLVWTEQALARFIEAPKKAVAGTKMAFPGLQDAGDRAALVAFIRQFSPGPGNIPEAPPTAPPRGGDAADDDPPVPARILAIEGDRDYGAYLASECLTCHQASGADKGIPSITRWPAEDFVRVVHAYKNKTRENPVMQLIAASLSDEQIAALAAYFEAAD